MSIVIILGLLLQMQMVLLKLTRFYYCQAIVWKDRLKIVTASSWGRNLLLLATVALLPASCMKKTGDDGLDRSFTTD